MVANIIMIVTLMLTALAIVREKEIGTMEQLMVTPIRPIELMLGKTLPFALVGLVDVVLVITGVRCWFSTCRFAAARCCCSLASVLFLMTSLGAGLSPLDDFADAAAGDDGDRSSLPCPRSC